MNPELISQSWEDQFLNWIAGLGIIITEDQRQIGGLRYFHFASQGQFGGSKALTGFGSHPNRKIAAIKCAAELIERRTMINFFEQNDHAIPALDQSSNGWAVHSSKDLSIEKAFNESIERHLLLKAYLTQGWQGFSFVDRMTVDGNELTFLISKYKVENKIAGMVICKSSIYAGVSFGYNLGNLADLQNTDFWQPAIFEAVDRILTLKGEPYPIGDENWIRKDIKYFLETPFDFTEIKTLPRFQVGQITNCDIGSPQIQSFDLSRKYNLDFPLFAAFVHGGNLIPLAPSPGRHPIL